jgi:hypothetical protein
MDWDKIYTKRLAARCKQAASDFGLEVQAPFELEGDGGSAQFVAHFPCFGSTRGTLVTLASQWSKLQELAIREGYACVGLYPEQFASYEREQWLRTFQQWEWCGAEEQRPNLY